MVICPALLYTLYCVRTKKAKKGRDNRGYTHYFTNRCRCPYCKAAEVFQTL